MVLKESVFLVNVLCSLVPCDVKYPYPETSGDLDKLKQHFKIEYNGPLTSGQNNFYFGHPIVWTPVGKLEGYFMKVVGGRKIYAFEGIPYAEDPVGQLRFRAPVPKRPWQGLYQANAKGPDCIQYNMVRPVRVFGSESCLFLNVYSPYIPFQGLNLTKIPVIVWFHGGTFLHGSGSDFGPSYFLQNDVILVTVNYRLGVLGFMSTGDSASPGNWGLKDQQLSLHWINQNIESFGGDSSRVTIMGQGSSSVHLQMMSPGSRNLFHSAVSLSGTAFNYWSVHSLDEARNLTYYYGKMIECPVHNGTDVLVDCLRQQAAFDLVQYQIPLLDDWFAPVILFRPTIEDSYQNAFLTETPEQAYKNNNVAKIPFMASYTAEEGLTFLLLHAVVGSIKMLRRDWNTLAPDFLDYEQFDLDTLEITRRVTWFYLKHVNSENAPINTFADMIRDRFILGGVHKALQAHCQIAPTYAYVFNYVGRYNLGATVAGYKPGEWGAGHGEDVYYFYNSSIKYNGFKKTDPELVLSKIMVNLVSNFAHKGEPIFTTEHGEDLRIWDAITDPKNITMLLIDKVIKMIPEPFMKNIHFWESLGLPDSQPLDFGNANPSIRTYGHSIYNNGLGPNTQITTPAPVPPNHENNQNEPPIEQLPEPNPALRSNYNQIQAPNPNAFDHQRNLNTFEDQRNPNALHQNNNFNLDKNPNILQQNNNFNQEGNPHALNLNQNNAINQAINPNVVDHNNLNQETNPNVLNPNNDFYHQQINTNAVHQQNNNLNHDANPNNDMEQYNNFNQNPNPNALPQNNNFNQETDPNVINQDNNFNQNPNPNALPQNNNFNQETNLNVLTQNNNFNQETDPNVVNQDNNFSLEIKENNLNQHDNNNINPEPGNDDKSQYDGEKPPEPIANPYEQNNNEVNQINEGDNNSETFQDGEAKMAREVDNSTNDIANSELLPIAPDENEINLETPPHVIDHPDPIVDINVHGSTGSNDNAIDDTPPEAPASLTNENENENESVKGEEENVIQENSEADVKESENDNIEALTNLSPEEEKDDEEEDSDTQEMSEK